MEILLERHEDILAFPHLMTGWLLKELGNSSSKNRDLRRLDISLNEQKMLKVDGLIIAK